MRSPAHVMALVAASALAAFTGYHFMTLYSVRSEWEDYAPIARRYLTAALEGDSTTLRATTASPDAAEWARFAAAREPADLRIWATSLRADLGRRSRDTVTVAFKTATRSCYLSPLVLQFVEGKVVGSSSACLHGS